MFMQRHKMWGSLVCYLVSGSGGCRLDRAGAMQDAASELRRIPLPRTPLNRGQEQRACRRRVYIGHMCGRNIVANSYYLPRRYYTVATTATNIDKTARTAYEMAEAQRDSFEAVAENFAAAHRRSIGLAEGGLEFMRLQEDNARAAQEFFANGVRLLQLQQKNAEFVQGWMGEALEVVREQAEHNARTAEAFARTAIRQQESMRALTQGWVGAYRDFFSPFAYVQQGMRTAQRATQQGLEATEQVARQGLRATEEATRQGLRVAEEATEGTEDVLRQTEKATREAELRTAVFSALKIANYDELSVAEVSRRIEGLPTEQLKKVREFERNHKNRETLVEQIDRKIRADENS